jgi:hypothetical protein
MVMRVGTADHRCDSILASLKLKVQTIRIESTLSILQPGSI